MKINEILILTGGFAAFFSSPLWAAGGGAPAPVHVPAPVYQPPMRAPAPAPQAPMRIPAPMIRQPQPPPPIAVPSLTQPPSPRISIPKKQYIAPQGNAPISRSVTPTVKGSIPSSPTQRTTPSSTGMGAQIPGTIYAPSAKHQRFFQTFGEERFKREGFFRHHDHRHFFSTFVFIPIVVAPYYADTYATDTYYPPTYYNDTYYEAPIYQDTYLPPPALQQTDNAEEADFLDESDDADESTDAKSQQIEGLIQDALGAMKIFDIPQFYNKPELSLLGPTGAG